MVVFRQTTIVHIINKMMSVFKDKIGKYK